MNNNDQRQEYRLDNQLTVIIELDSSDAGEPTLVVSKSLDISANGLRAIAHEAVATDIILRCCIRDEKHDRQFLLVSEVKWCRPHSDGDYLIGLSLFDSDGTDIVKWKEYIAQSCAD
ncbi:PilZ domain-containing protein [Cellvibrio sp. OA-2007]|uniref:PilZ domain-containing protein n=1 Tax=Cellvibrio sp. OA-2007 TaxID=529823 RepID=UPI000782371B|nr:PilZ domain-containing protein [Cellvibrio sp. OA-2007]